MKLTSLEQAVTLSLYDDSGSEYDANFMIEVEGETWTTYTAAITHRDILLYCDKGTATLLVDSYGDRHTCELFDWESEG